MQDTLSDLDVLASECWKRAPGIPGITPWTITTQLHRWAPINGNITHTSITLAFASQETALQVFFSFHRKIESNSAKLFSRILKLQKLLWHAERWYSECFSAEKHRQQFGKTGRSNCKRCFTIKNNTAAIRKQDTCSKSEWVAIFRLFHHIKFAICLQKHFKL